MATHPTTHAAHPDAHQGLSKPTPHDTSDPSYHQSAADKPVEERWDVPPPPVNSGTGAVVPPGGESEPKPAEAAPKPTEPESKPAGAEPKP